MNNTPYGNQYDNYPNNSPYGSQPNNYPNNFNGFPGGGDNFNQYGNPYSSPPPPFGNMGGNTGGNFGWNTGGNNAAPSSYRRKGRMSPILPIIVFFFAVFIVGGWYTSLKSYSKYKNYVSVTAQITARDSSTRTVSGYDDDGDYYEHEETTLYVAVSYEYKGQTYTKSRVTWYGSKSDYRKEYVTVKIDPKKPESVITDLKKGETGEIMIMTVVTVIFGAVALFVLRNRLTRRLRDRM